MIEEKEKLRRTMPRFNLLATMAFSFSPPLRRPPLEVLRERLKHVLAECPWEHHGRFIHMDEPSQGSVALRRRQAQLLQVCEFTFRMEGRRGLDFSEIMSFEFYLQRLSQKLAEVVVGEEFLVMITGRMTLTSCRGNFSSNGRPISAYTAEMAMGEDVVSVPAER